MAFAQPVKSKKKPTASSRKRTGAHHRRSKTYTKQYWPYLPMAAIVGLGLLANIYLSSSNSVLGVRSDLSDSSLLTYTNAHRADLGLSQLELNEQLDAAAQAKAEDMVNNNYWSHNSPTGKSPWSFVIGSGYNYAAAGENLAFGFTDADDVIKAWMNSAEHRRNISSTSYRQVGFGLATSPNYVGQSKQTVVVALYARPSPLLGTSLAATSALPSSQKFNEVQQSTISRFAMMSNNSVYALAGLLLILGGAVGVVITRHGVFIHKILVRGEYAVLQHPIIDITVTLVLVAGVLLLQTSGIIR